MKRKTRSRRYKRKSMRMNVKGGHASNEHMNEAQLDYQLDSSPYTSA